MRLLNFKTAYTPGWSAYTDAALDIGVGLSVLAAIEIERKIKSKGWRSEKRNTYQGLLERSKGVKSFYSFLVSLLLSSAIFDGCALTSKSHFLENIMKSTNSAISGKYKIFFQKEKSVGFIQGQNAKMFS